MLVHKSYTYVQRKENSNTLYLGQKSGSVGNELESPSRAPWQLEASKHLAIPSADVRHKILPVVQTESGECISRVNSRAKLSLPSSLS